MCGAAVRCASTTKLVAARVWSGVQWQRLTTHLQTQSETTVCVRNPKGGRSSTTYCRPSGVERRDRALRFDGVLGEQLPASMEAEFEQVLVRGRLMAEVALLHRPTRTLLLVDLIERFGDDTPNVNWVLRASMKLVGTWNRPTLAPEYRIVGWKDRAAARAALERILAWDFGRVVIAHGDLIEHDAKAVLRRAWRATLT